jgi:hypothetical protein
MRHEILYNKTAEISGRICQSDFEYVPKKLMPMQRAAWSIQPRYEGKAKNKST